MEECGILGLAVTTEQKRSSRKDQAIIVHSGSIDWESDGRLSGGIADANRTWLDLDVVPAAQHTLGVEVMDSHKNIPINCLEEWP